MVNSLRVTGASSLAAGLAVAEAPISLLLFFDCMYLRYFYASTGVTSTLWASFSAEWSGRYGEGASAFA